MAVKDSLHDSHKHVRWSDASSFDYICEDCGATDRVPGGWASLAKPCKPSPQYRATPPSQLVKHETKETT